jgi:hypothetical protein
LWGYIPIVFQDAKFLQSVQAFTIYLKSECHAVGGEAWCGRGINMKQQGLLNKKIIIAYEF